MTGTSPKDATRELDSIRSTNKILSEYKPETKDRLQELYKDVVYALQWDNDLIETVYKKYINALKEILKDLKSQIKLQA